jgi:uncharacterized protein YdeI (YjbR/CyaY-like superfamily)
MEPSDKLEAFYSRERPFKKELCILRELARKTEARETLKWGSPVYTINGKNVFGIMGFKHHFGLWFFNGVFLKDPEGVLVAAQEETKAMRHWKFTSRAEIRSGKVLAYMEEAIANQKKGMEHRPEGKKKVEIPGILVEALGKDNALMLAFKALTPYKQSEDCEHIASAKQEKTRQSRLEKSLTLIRKGISLNEKYR